MAWEEYVKKLRSASELLSSGRAIEAIIPHLYIDPSPGNVAKYLTCVASGVRKGTIQPQEARTHIEIASKLSDLAKSSLMEDKILEVERLMRLELRTTSS